MHWSEHYVGLPYAEADCAELAQRVRREVFGQETGLPSERAASLRGLTVQIETLKADYAEPVTEPREGDAVLMVGRGRLDHIGIYCEINNTPYVLHAQRNAGHTVLHRLRELPGVGLRLEGFYRWK